MKTLKQSIADLGIDESHAVKLMNRRQRAALLRDRTKVFTTTRLGAISDFCLYPYRNKTAVDLGALIHAGETNNTALYVKAWCRLNHLKA